MGGGRDGTVIDDGTAEPTRYFFLELNFVNQRSSSAEAAAAYNELAAECLRRCDEIASFTETEGQITRRFLTPPARQVHQRAGLWMTRLGMTVRTDDAGNLIGTRAADADSDQTLLLGSHLDTVPNGGKYDGALGVVAALAVVESLAAKQLPFHLDVIGFSEEEGVRFAQPFLGSRAVAGTFDTAWLDRLDDKGQSMRSAIQAFQLDPDRIRHAAYRSERVLAYVETHIEQGPHLARSNRPLGVVEAIAGQSRLMVGFRGEPAHAGTTPMQLRRDPLVAASRWIAHVSEFARGVDALRATVGYANIQPNVRNVVPGYVELSVDVRHPSDGIRADAVAHLCNEAKSLARQCDVEFEVLEEQSQPAVSMDPQLVARLNASLSACGGQPLTMISGAGHDAAVMAEHFPTAILFIRQPSGTSHHPDEDVEQEDVAAAIEVLNHFVCSLAADRGNAS